MIGSMMFGNKSKYPLWIGVLICLGGLALTAYNLFAWQRRRLTIGENGLHYYNWRGCLVLAANWDEVQGIRLLLKEGNGESTPHRLYTTKGSVNLVGLSDVYDLESHILSELRRRKIPE